jgi:hypothetical protein
MKVHELTYVSRVRVNLVQKGKLLTPYDLAMSCSVNRSVCGQMNRKDLLRFTGRTCYQRFVREVPSVVNKAFRISPPIAFQRLKNAALSNSTGSTNFDRNTGSLSTRFRTVPAMKDIFKMGRVEKADLHSICKRY